ncbi:MAG: beta-lactamase family protein [Firmicutes bacterium]|nr:beta-lactamase family protein [Bacillota bacterium]
MTKNITEFSELIYKHFKKSKHSFVSIGFSIDNQEHYYNFGETEDRKNIKFGLGSISKTFIGSYLAKLLFQNKISLSDHLDSYLELNKNIYYPTILELLTHSSGYSFFIPRIPTIKVMVFNGFNKKNIYEGIKRDWVYSYLKTKKPKRIKKYCYSDFNYAILALIIEKIENRPYIEVIKEYITNDIGLKETNYFNLTESKNCGYSWIWEDDNPFLASGGMYSSVKDMLVFLKYQYDEKNEYLNMSHEKYSKTFQKNIFSGFSWNSFLNGKFYWHIGGQGRFRSYALFDKRRHIAITILATVDINLQHVNRIGSQLYRALKRNYRVIVDFLDSIVQDNQKKIIEVTNYKKA